MAQYKQDQLFETVSFANGKDHLALPGARLTNCGKLIPGDAIRYGPTRAIGPHFDPWSKVDMCQRCAGSIIPRPKGHGITRATINRIINET